MINNNRKQNSIELESFYIFSPDGDTLLVELYGTGKGLTISFGDYRISMDQESAIELAEKIFYNTMEDL